MTDAEKLQALNEASDKILSIRSLILKMCDDLDATNDIVDKEAIRQAIILSERDLEEAESQYNIIVQEIAQ